VTVFPSPAIRSPVVYLNLSVNLDNPECYDQGSWRLYHRHRFPTEIEAVWLDVRFFLSFRMVEDIFAYKGMMVTHKRPSNGRNHQKKTEHVGAKSLLILLALLDQPALR
jgi:hypothetical protein